MNDFREWLLQAFRTAGHSASGEWRLALAVAVLGTWLPAAAAQTPAHWTAGTGNWTTAGNWDINTVPNNGSPAGSTYNAFLDGLNGNTAYTVTLNSNITVTSFALSSSFATLTQTSGSIFQTTTATISAGTYQVNGATVRGGRGRSTAPGRCGSTAVPPTRWTASPLTALRTCLSRAPTSG